MSQFVHLHVHTQFSLLDGASQIKTLFEKAKSLGMPAMAITDHGNMFGVMHFMAEAEKQGIKPIIGCEVYVADGSMTKKMGKDDRSGYHLILLARNKEGYHNLAKLVSRGYTEGFYYTPRIDKDLLREHTGGLIALSACLGGELPQKIMKSGMHGAGPVVEEFRAMFGDDYYLELQNHGLPEQQEVNKVILELGREYGIRVVATNDVHFVNAEDHEAHHILICLNTGREVEDQEGMHYTGQEYLKSEVEMRKLFPDNPEVITNTLEIAEKVELYSLKRDVILPVYPLPEGFSDADSYLRHLSYEGAKTKYPEITEEVSERLDYELDVIKGMGYAGYFLIVQDFIAEARRQGTLVGPGRGSAAGSAVAFAVGITDVEPLKYRLLFERFLNPERMSMPDIDVDFDDYGREDVIRYVVNKYGHDRVAQIVTYGTMAAKSAIRDVARVLKLPLNEADRLAKLVPDGPNVSLEAALKEVPQLVHEMAHGDDLVKKTLKFAKILEGSVRQTGTHACGVIIGPESLFEHIPLCVQKDADIMVTQYDGKHIEGVGMLKMDFLGLKTLSIIKDAMIAIEARHGVRLDLDNIPLDDPKTYDLFKAGDTIGIFQFESDGMQGHLKRLEPEGIEDLIAMNALFRPGPMAYIPVFIERKQGLKPVEYPHEMLVEILSNTYGIMVYQEQIMQVAQVMGGFSLGQADILRKAMGKKDMKTMLEQRAKFIQGAAEKGITTVKATEVFDTMTKFAEYGFNRSHSAAYSILAYKTAYIKAHYPAEYMAAVLTHNLSEIKKITFLIDACQQNGIKVNGPDINKSGIRFSTSETGEILFGLGAIKGVGEIAAEAVISERKKNGPFTSIFDFVKRISLKTVNKRCLESMAMAGAFDGFPNTHRAQFFHAEGSEGQTFIEKLIRFGSAAQQIRESAQQSLFGDMEDVAIPDPDLPDCEPWPSITQLNNEKEVIGFYISGHPLDQYAIEIKAVCHNQVEEVREEHRKFLNRDFSVGVMVNTVQHKQTKTGRPFATLNVEDFSGSWSLSVFSETYLKYKHLMNPGDFLFIKGDYTTRMHNENDPFLRVKEIKLLSEVLDHYVKSISLSLDLNAIEVNEDLAGRLMNLIRACPGNTKLKIFLRNQEDAMVFTIPKRYVSPYHFLRRISEIEGIAYKLSDK
ncbi:MAG: DNA polymerase III subunit alpha [Bacteroidales bacterium]